MNNATYKDAWDLASGKKRFVQNYAADKYVRESLENSGNRAQMSAKYELAIWQDFDKLCQELSPKCKFNAQSGIANNHEKIRRNAMFGVIRLVDFRSQDKAIETLFKKNFGQVSLQWMLTVCETDAPPFYYEWAFDAISDVSSKIWGPAALERIKTSWPHMEVFQKLAPEKFNLLTVKRVMQS